jgi:hypothetical protein
MHSRWWTTTEDEAMRMFYPLRGGPWVAKRLGRTVPAIHGRASRLQLRVTGNVISNKQRARYARGRETYTAADYFDDHIMPITETGCWIWMGYAAANGHPVMRYAGKARMASQYAWETLRGERTGRVWRSCGQSLCVNPWHSHMKGVHE